MGFSAVRRWWPLVGVTALLALAALAAAHSSPRIDRIDPPGLGVGPGEEPLLEVLPTEEPSRRATVEGFEAPDWLTTIGLGLCGLVVLVIVGGLLWTLIREFSRRSGIRRRPRAVRSSSAARTARTTQEVVAALDAGLVDLSDTDADPRRVVIACWVRLEQAAATAGTPREVGDSPTDLVTRLLRAHEVNADVLAAFAQVYRQARYATHEVDERMRGEARSALHRLRAELGQGRPASGAGVAR